MLNLKKIRDIMRNDAGVNGDAQRVEQIVWILFLKLYDYYDKNYKNEAALNAEDYQSIIPPHLAWDSWAAQYQKDKAGKFILNQSGQKIASPSAKTGDELLKFINDELFSTLKTLPDSENIPVFKRVVAEVFKGANNYMKDGFLLRQVINEIDQIEFNTTHETKRKISTIYESFLKELQSAGKSGEFYTPRAVTDFCMQILKPQIGDKIADLACGTGGFLTSAYHYLFKDGNHSPKDEAVLNESFFGIEKKQLPYILCATNFLINGIESPQIKHSNAFDFQNFEELDGRTKFNIIAMNPPYGGNEKNDEQQRFPSEFKSSETADLFMALITERLAHDGRAAVVLPDGFLFGTDTAKINLKKRLLNEFNLHLIIRLPKSVFAPYTSIATNILFFNKSPLGTKNTHFYRLDMPENLKSFGKTKSMQMEHFAPFFAWDKEGRPDISENGGFKARRVGRAELEQNGLNFDLCGFVSESEEILAPEELIAQIRTERGRLNATLDGLLTQISEIIKENR